MATSITNILGNLANVIFTTFKETSELFVKRKRRIMLEKHTKERQENRQKIIEEAPGIVRSFEFEKSVHDILINIKKWLPQRKWLQANHIEFSQFKEEIEYWALVR